MMEGKGKNKGKGTADPCGMTTKGPVQRRAQKKTVQE